MSDSFESLCAFVAFVAPAFEFPLLVLTEKDISLLCDLLSSGAGIEQLLLKRELPSSPVVPGLTLALARCPSIRSLSAGYRNEEWMDSPRLVEAISTSAQQSLEQLHFMSISFPVKLCSILGETIEKCTQLRTVSFHHCDLDAMQLIAAGMGKLPELESVSFVQNWLGDKSIKRLAEVLQKLLRLRELVLSWDLSRFNIAIALSRPPVAKSLRVLDLTNNSISNSGLAGLATLNLRMLRTLRVARNRLDKAGITAVSQIVRRASGLRILDVSSNTISGVSIAGLLGKAIASVGASLEELDVCACRLSQIECVTMFGAMKGSCTRLSRVDVGWNQHGGEDIITATECIMTGRLTELRMKHNKIRDPGAKQLAKLLLTTTALQVLDVSGNWLGDESAAAIFDALAGEGRWRMREVRANECCVGDQGAEAAGRILAGVGCDKLYLKANKIGPAGAKALAAAANASRTQIARLDLERNPKIGREGTEAIAEQIILPNRSVVKLNLYRVGMGDGGAKVIANAVRRRAKGKLRWIWIDDRELDKEGHQALVDARWESGCEIALVKS